MHWKRVLLSAGLLLSFCFPRAEAQPQQTSPPDQAKPPAPATYSGCVMQSPNVATIYLLATKDRCLVLRGDYDAAKAAGHETQFKGTLVEASGNKPPSLTVQLLVGVNAACSRTCTLPPPGHRGLSAPAPGFQSSDPQQGDANAKPKNFPEPPGTPAPHP